MHDLKPTMPSLVLLPILLLVMVTPWLWSQKAAAMEPAQDPAQEMAQMPGFPLEIGPWIPDPLSRGVALADLDGDQDLELVYPHNTCTSENWFCNVGQVSAWSHDGEALPGFPVAVEGTVTAPVSIDDLDGDGTHEIVLITNDIMTDKGFLYVIDSQGKMLEGFPMVLGLTWSFTSLHDLDRDGQKEIIFASVRHLYVVSLDGSLWDKSWPVDIHRVSGDTICGLTGAISVGDVDGDDLPEMAVATDSSVVLVRADGSIVDGWPKPFPIRAHSIGSYTLLADFDRDFDLEVVVARNIPTSITESYVEVHVLQHNSEPMPGWPLRVHGESVMLFSAPLVTDLEGDGRLEVVVAVGYNFPPPMTPPPGDRIYAWDDSGSLKEGFPRQWQSGSGPGVVQIVTAVDTNGDGSMELYMDSMRAGQDDGCGYIFGIDAHGNDLPGFPLRPRGFTHPNGAIFGDVDQDGDYELAATGLGNDGLLLYLYDIPFSYRSTDMSWPTFHASNDRSGLFKRRYRDRRFVRAGTRIGSGR
jgi:hypothetical protein